MPNILSCANYLMISLKSIEPFNLTIPGKLQNYLALGKPIISFAHGITNQIIKEANCGYAADINNLDLNDLTYFILKNQNEYKMSINGQQYASNNFEKKKIINNLLASL